MCLLLATLSGCLCLPEEGEGVDTNYFDQCWSQANKNAKPLDGIAPKP